MSIPKFISKTVLVTVVVLIVGCTDAAELQEGNINFIKNHLVYFKDDFGICYAYIRNSGSVLATVPCDKVGL